MSQSTDPSKLNEDEGSAEVFFQPMGFTDILDSTFSLYRNHFRLFVGISAVYFIWHVARSMSIHWTLDYCDQIVWHLVYGGLAFASAQVYLGRRITIRASFRQVKRQFWAYVGGNLLWLLAIALMSITVIGIPFAILFAVRWAFLALTILVEENSAKAALHRSGELVGGSWWRVFGNILAIFFLVLIIGLVFLVLLTSIIVLSDISGEMDILDLIQRAVWNSHDSVENSMHPLHIVGTAIEALTLPIVAIGCTLLYFDQRIRKEQFDIEMLVTHGSV